MIGSSVVRCSQVWGSLIFGKGLLLDHMGHDSRFPDTRGYRLSPGVGRKLVYWPGPGLVRVTGRGERDHAVGGRRWGCCFTRLHIAPLDLAAIACLINVNDKYEIYAGSLNAWWSIKLSVPRSWRSLHTKYRWHLYPDPWDDWPKIMVNKG